MNLVITKRMQSLIDCIDEIYNKKDNTYSKINIIAGVYSDEYKSLNGVRPRFDHMVDWEYQDYLAATDKLADLMEYELEQQKQEKLFEEGRIGEALKNSYSNSPFTNIFKEKN